MKVKALVSFSGLITMALGEERDIGNRATYDDLIQAGYVEEVKKEVKKKADTTKKVNTSED